MNRFLTRARIDRPLWRWIPTLLVLAVLAAIVRHVDHGTSHPFLLANSFEIVDWLMQESLDVLVNTLGLGSYMNTDVQKEFEHDFAPGETVRVPYPAEFLIREGLAYTEQPINKRHTTVSCTNIFGIDFGWDSFEAALRLERPKEELKRNYIDSPMAQLAQEIENRIANWGRLNTSTTVGILGTDPTTFDASSAAARQQLVNLGCPPVDQGANSRGIFVTPGIMRALKNTNASAFNPQIDVSKMMRTGIVGYGDGFDWHESVSLYQHTAGTWAGAVTVNGAGQSGNTLTITATAGDTFKAGDKVSIANVNPTNPRTRRKIGSSARVWGIAADLTAAGGGVDVLQLNESIYGPGSPYQNVDALPANSAALTLWPGTSSPNGKVGTINLALHRNAFALVSVPFDNPKEGGSVRIARKLRDEETGIEIAFLRMFDGYLRKWITRFDICMGFGNLYNGNCAVAIAGA